MFVEVLAGQLANAGVSPEFQYGVETPLRVEQAVSSVEQLNPLGVALG